MVDVSLLMRNIAVYCGENDDTTSGVNTRILFNRFIATVPCDATEVATHRLY